MDKAQRNPGDARRAVALTLLCLFLAPLAAQPWGCGVKVKPADQADLREAIGLYDKHQYSLAAKQLRRLAQRNPKAAEPQFWLGMCGVKDGFNTAAIRRYFTRCIELCPQYPDALAHFYMGIVLYTDERYEEAVASLERYFALANNSQETHYAAVYEEASNYLHWSRFLAEAQLNTVPFEPQRVRGVSSRHDEALPYLSPDGKTFYYLRRVPDAPRNRNTFYSSDNQPRQWRLYQSTPLGDTAFTSGQPLPAPFNSGLPEGSVSTTADGSELYYSRIVAEGGYNNSDLYLVRRRNGRWQQPEPLPATINGPRTWESQPTVSPDGSTLIFASNRPGGQGGTDLWRCHRLKNGDWSRPENLGPSVNTPGNDKAPFLAADGHTLYFLSDGWQGFGGYDIYFTDLADDSRPTNLGLPINTEDNEVSFGVAPDGRRAYFAGRTAESHSADVLMFDLYPAARPEPMAFVTVNVGIAPHTAADSATVTLFRADGSTTTYRSRGDQVSLMLPAKGESLVSIGSGRWIEFAYVTPRDLDGTGWFLAADDTLRADLTFLPGSRLDARSERLLDAVARHLIDHPLRHLEILCPRHPEAKAVRDYLVNRKKLRPDRLSYRGGTDIGRPYLVLQ